MAEGLGGALHEHDPQLAHPDCTDECVALAAVTVFKAWLQEREQRLEDSIERWADENYNAAQQDYKREHWDHVSLYSDEIAKHAIAALVSALEEGE